MKDDSWARLQFVSLARDGRVIGYINASIDREANNITQLGIISFEPGNLCARDIRAFAKGLFLKFRFNKVCFSAIVGSPVARTYDRLAANYGGRVVGVWRDETRLWDGLLYDVKLYEILRSDFERVLGERALKKSAGDFCLPLSLISHNPPTI